MDISATTAPDSTQVNADDLIAGPVTVTISGVRAGTSEQPVNVDLTEYPGRAYRPSKTMRRVLVAAWGPEASAYVGRRLTLYRDPEISFGRDRVGGIRISAMSHISKPLSLALTVARGKRAPFVVEPLPDLPAAPSEADVAASTDKAQLGAWWREHHHLRASIEARVEALKTAGDELPLDPS